MTRDICLLNAEYQTYGERWFILLVALFCNMAAGLLWMPYSAMTDKASIYFQVSEDHIELWPTIVFGSCVCAGIPAMWVLDRKCLKSGVGDAFDCFDLMQISLILILSLNRSI